jgi:NifU-like protein involved in Fe-S cluster formation
MASKFLVPLQLPELNGATFSNPSEGFVKAYILNGWLTKKDSAGTVIDLVLDRTLTTYSVAGTAAAITSADTVITAFGKLQKSLNSINLTGDVTGTAAYVSGALTVAVTIAANSVALGTDTTGDYVAGVTSGTGITVSNSGGEGSTPSVAFKNAANLSDNTLPIWDGAAGNLKNSPIQFNGSEIIINANFVVNGTTTTVNTETVLLADNIVTLNSNYTGSAPTENAGIEVERGTLTNVSLIWNETTDKWQLTTDGSTFYNILTTNDPPNVVAGAGITVTVSGGQVTVAHTDTSTAATTSNVLSQVIQNISVDTFGHVTAVNSTTLKYSTLIGDGVATVFNINHAKGDNVHVQVFEANFPAELIECEVIATTANDVQLIFALPPMLNEFKVVII